MLALQGLLNDHNNKLGEPSEDDEMTLTSGHRRGNEKASENKTMAI